MIPFVPKSVAAVALIAALGGALLWVRHSGYEAGRAYESAQWRAEVAAGQKRAAAATAAILDRIGKSDATLGAAIADLGKRSVAARTIIQKELTHEVRYADPACSLTRGVLDTLNAGVTAYNSALVASGSPTVPLSIPDGGGLARGSGASPE